MQPNCHPDMEHGTARMAFEVDYRLRSHTSTYRSRLDSASSAFDVDLVADITLFCRVTGKLECVMIAN